MLFAQSIEDVMKAFDETLMEMRSVNAKVTIGFITFEESSTCGSVVLYFQNEIKKAAEHTRRIEIVKTTELSDYEQAGIMTRGINSGMSKKARTNNDPAYNLDGKYYERGDNIELVLTLCNSDKKIFAEKSAFIPKAVLSKNKLTLYPKNKGLAETIQEDFDKSEKELEEEQSAQARKKSAKNIGLAASIILVDSRELVNILKPKDRFRIRITADTDCYLAILGINANGEKNWLSPDYNFIRADQSREFPDRKSEGDYIIEDDGVFGAEQVIIYAATDESILPHKAIDSGKYSNEDLHAIMRKQQAVRRNTNQATGTFKITYTIMEN